MTVLTNTGQEEKNSLAFLPPVQPDLLLDNFPAWWSGSTEKKHLGKHVPQLQGIKKCLLEKCSLSNLEEPIMKLWLLYLFVSRIRCTPPSSTDCKDGGVTSCQVILCVVIDLLTYLSPASCAGIKGSKTPLCEKKVLNWETNLQHLFPFHSREKWNSKSHLGDFRGKEGGCRVKQITLWLMHEQHIVESFKKHSGEANKGCDHTSMSQGQQPKQL